MIDVNEFRNGMSMLGGAVSVVTTTHEQIKYGMTVSAVCSVTDSPPSLLVCINQNAWSHNYFTSSGILCVNVLSSAHKTLSRHFADKRISMAERFNTHSWSILNTGAPALDDALVNFDCKISAINQCGSHSVFFTEIKAIRIGDSKTALMYFDRNYHDLPILAKAMDELTA
ncbi:flavin reductase [Photorhabdus luminescens]|nr:flavin reductase [Photorhabdus luminescens]